MLASSVAERQEAVWWRSRFRDTVRGLSKNWCEAVLQSLERWPQERSLTPFDHIFIVILHGPLRFREESGSGCARSWSGALGTILRTTRVGQVLFRAGTHPSCLPQSFSFCVFSDNFCTDTSRFVGVNSVPSISQMVTVNLSNNALHADHVVSFLPPVRR